MQKDKPIWSPIWILSPSRFLSSQAFPFKVAIPWWIAIQALSWLEPLPAELPMNFSWNYLAWSHFFGMLGLLLPALALAALVPAGQHKDRFSTAIRVSMGASFWYLWTFPLTFLELGMGGSVLLMLLRPLLWATTLAWTLGPYLPVSRISGAIRWFWILPVFFVSMLIQMGKDLPDALKLRMDDVGTGKILGSTSELGERPLDSAVWTLTLNAPVPPDRLSLGSRQTVKVLGPQRIEVVVRNREVPPPEDTSETLNTKLSHGKRLDALIDSARLYPDSLQLLALHQIVHGAIRYQRTYFPGSPEQILTKGEGDCKSFAIVYAALVRRLGFRAKVVRGVIAMNGGRPENSGFFAHAWVSVETPTGWQDWDPTSSSPFPDAGYLRFAIPAELDGAFDGENAIFNLASIQIRSMKQVPFRP
ncbi:MAG: transglutaminase family protein [Fibrobacterota bacterium]|nr:transglutaminase family protein [Fibrobacterota bacterium]QQS03126.1 MAG: transglutaminase family protein [Fibrobacterota bacterium]